MYVLHFFFQLVPIICVVSIACLGGGQTGFKHSFKKTPNFQNGLNFDFYFVMLNQFFFL